MSPSRMISPTAAHYDAVTEAWRLVMGDAFHYGVFPPDGGDGDPADLLPQATIRLNEVMLTAAGPVGPAARVLDVGCGVGGPARWLAAQTGARVLGITNSPAGVAVARSQTPRSLAGQVEFTVADALHNGQPDGVFDVVWVMESSHLMADKARLVSECARVLRPGGRLVLCDLMVVRPFELAEVFAEHDALKCLDRVFGRAKMQTAAAYRGYCRSAALRWDADADLTTATRPTLLAWRANLRQHRATMLELLGGAALQDFERACGILLDYWDAGRMGYGLVSATRP